MTHMTFSEAETSRESLFKRIVDRLSGAARAQPKAEDRHDANDPFAFDMPPVLLRSYDECTGRTA